MNPLITNLMIVGAGSCLGGMARYAVSRAVQSVCNCTFPWGTFIVNVLGCLIIGLIFGFIDRGYQLSAEMRLFLTVGVCGGFTAFSTFMNENYLLFTGSGHLTALLYILSSVVAGFLMLYLAYYITRVL